MQISRTLRAFVFTIAPLAGCAVAKPPVAPAPTAKAMPVARQTIPAPAPELAIDETCPMSVPGTTVAVEDNVDGAALVFTTSGDVTALRTRVIEVANDHNREHLKIGALPVGTQRTYASGGDALPAGTNTDDHQIPQENSGTYASGGNYGQTPQMNMKDQPIILTHSRAQIEPFDGGVRLVFIGDAQDVQALRDEVRLHADHMATGRCD